MSFEVTMDRASRQQHGRAVFEPMMITPRRRASAKPGSPGHSDRTPAHHGGGVAVAPTEAGVAIALGSQKCIGTIADLDNAPIRRVLNRR